MKHLKSQSLFFIAFVFHQSLSQQSTQQYNQQSPQQYSQQSSQQYNQQPSQQYNQQSSQQYVQQNQNKIQLEDIERDNLKSSQQQSTQQQTQSQQYVPVTQDQHQLLYSIQPQQTNLFSASQQAAVGTPSVYTSQPITTMLISPQQQQLIQPYYTQTQQSYPYIDFGGFPLYPGLYPFVLPQTSQQTNQISSGVVNDYYKTIQPAASAVKTPPVSSAVKSVPTTQVPAISNYLLSNAIPNTFYQPVSFTQPQNAQQYLSYNYYQSQNPQKSVFSAGIKSTTPSVPVKGKEDQFVPVTNGNYRFEYSTVDQNNYNKVRLSG